MPRSPGPTGCGRGTVRRGKFARQPMEPRPDRAWQGFVPGTGRQSFRSDRYRPFPALFDKLCQDRRYAGYRLSGRYQEKLTEAFRDLEHGREAKDGGFSCGKYSLQDAEAIATRLPAKDHHRPLWKRPLGRRAFDPQWVRRFKSLAGRPNVYQGLRPLRTGEAPTRSQEGFFHRPILELAYDAFGEDRLVYGSDWPVTETTGDYESVLKLARAWAGTKGDAFELKLFYQMPSAFMEFPKFRYSWTGDFSQKNKIEGLLTIKPSEG